MYRPWTEFLRAQQSVTAISWPPIYSAPNIFAQGTVTLEAAPTADWVAKYPTGRLWYYRYFRYPTKEGTELDVPSPFTAFVQAWAEGYTAERYAVDKARGAYARAEAQLRELVKDDNDQQTDWED
jgi:hypothetical protein